MNTNQLQELVNDVKENIFGQFIGLTCQSDGEFLAEYAKQGFKKITRYNVQLAKKSYCDIINTSTGAVNANIEVNPKRQSYYIDLFLNGFVSCLRSDTTKFYLKVAYDADKHNTVKSVYVDGSGQVIGNSFEDVKQYIKPSVIKKITEGYGREKELRENDIHVHINYFKIDNVLSLSVSGRIYKDYDLSKMLVTDLV